MQLVHKLRLVVQPDQLFSVPPCAFGFATDQLYNDICCLSYWVSSNYNWPWRIWICFWRLTLACNWVCIIYNWISCLRYWWFRVGVHSMESRAVTGRREVGTRHFTICIFALPFSQYVFPTSVMCFPLPPAYVYSDRLTMPIDLLFFPLCVPNYVSLPYPQYVPFSLSQDRRGLQV
jgi:hypothetical protein